MFSTLINRNGRQLRSSFFRSFQAALEYAEKMAGIIAIESPQGEIVWERI
jgi:hypothetical protein